MDFYLHYQLAATFFVLISLFGLGLCVTLDCLMISLYLYFNHFDLHCACWRLNDHLFLLSYVAWALHLTVWVPASTTTFKASLNAFSWFDRTWAASRILWNKIYYGVTVSWAHFAMSCSAILGSFHVIFFLLSVLSGGLRLHYIPFCDLITLLIGFTVSWAHFAMSGSAILGSFHLIFFSLECLSWCLVVLSLHS